MIGVAIRRLCILYGPLNLGHSNPRTTNSYLGVRGNDFGWAEGEVERIRDLVGFLIDELDAVLLIDDVVLRNEVVLDCDWSDAG